MIRANPDRVSEFQDGVDLSQRYQPVRVTGAGAHLDRPVGGVGKVGRLGQVEARHGRKAFTAATVQRTPNYHWP